MIELIKLDKLNDEVAHLLSEMHIDDSILEYVNNILFINNCTFAIKINNNYIGLIKVVSECNDDYSVEIGILKKYHKMNYGTEAMNKIIEYIKNNYNYRKIIMRINYQNTSSICLSNKCGFKKDYDEIEKCNDEGLSYDVYSIVNQNYKQKIKTKQVLH